MRNRVADNRGLIYDRLLLAPASSVMSHWWDDLESWEDRTSGGDTLGGAEFIPDKTIMADHNILANVRNNEFDLNDPTYCEFSAEYRAAFLQVSGFRNNQACKIYVRLPCATSCVAA